MSLRCITVTCYLFFSCSLLCALTSLILLSPQIFIMQYYISKQGSSNLLMIILAMDLIDKVLTDHSLNKDAYLPSICAACTMSKHILNKYYRKTDNLEMYRIAMSKYFP